MMLPITMQPQVFARHEQTRLIAAVVKWRAVWMTCLMLGLAFAAAAQPATDKNTSIGNPVAVANSNKSKPATSAPEKTSIGATNEDARIAALSQQLRFVSEQLDKLQSEQSKIELDYTRNFYDYSKKKNDVIIELFAWQKHASEILMWVVILLVISGISFSGVQLFNASRLGAVQGETSFEIAASRLKITSSVVGLIVLAISVIFFYLFLIEVYRMKVVDLSPLEQRPGATAPTK